MAMLPLPPTAALLVQGGDQRIEIQPGSHLNKYGCQPFPAADRIAFASSTASQISAGAFAAADRLRDRLAVALDGLPARTAASVYHAELARIRTELLGICELQAPADAPDVIFAASGTDAHLLASHLAAAESRRARHAMRVIMVNAEESGSGVSLALSGRSFSAYNALGLQAGEANDAGAIDAAEQPPHVGESFNHSDSSALRTTEGYDVIHVPIRHTDGAPRSSQAIAADVDFLTTSALQTGHDILLVLIDVSKTGCVAPDPQFAHGLQQRWPGRVHVLVDACQFRIETATLRAYLAQNFMVAITGSKFIGGPSFSAALLIPQTSAAHMRPAGVPRALKGHSASEEWPAGWRAEATLSSCANPGLLLRWEAALHEFNALQSISGSNIRRFLLAFNAAVQSRLASDPRFEALSSPVLPARGKDLAPEWDDLPTIHAFILRHQLPSPRALDSEQVMAVYQGLQDEQHANGFFYALGQPVACGKRDGIERSVLRLCVSANLMVQACATSDAAAGEALISHAMACLDNVAALIDSLWRPG